MILYFNRMEDFPLDSEQVIYCRVKSEVQSWEHVTAILGTFDESQQNQRQRGIAQRSFSKLEWWIPRH